MAQQNNEPRHYLSGDGVLKEAWNAESNSLEVALKNTDISIELSAEDGDNVTALRQSSTLEDGEHSCEGMKTMCRYGAEGSVEVSPDKTGDSWYAIETQNLIPKDICAMRIKVINCKVVVCG